MSFKLCGVLMGHCGWVTQIAVHPNDPETIVSSSRDGTLIVWRMNLEGDTKYGYPHQCLRGHSSYISSVDVATNGNYVVSGSWDSTVCLWDLITGQFLYCFEGHTNYVLSVAFSEDYRRILSGSRDGNIKLWNTQSVCMQTIGEEDSHTDWVSCVRFSPDVNSHVAVSCGWDETVKVWNLDSCQVRHNLNGHREYVNSVEISPDGTLCCSGGKDTKAMLWDVNGGGRLLTLEHGNEINDICFSPSRFWMAVAHGPSIKIWDVASKLAIDELHPVAASVAEELLPQCLCLAWSTDGQTIFAGYSDSTIRIWQMSESDE